VDKHLQAKSSNIESSRMPNVKAAKSDLHDIW